MGVKKGLVIKSTGSWYYVKDEQSETIPCKIKGTYRIKGIRATNPVAVGDEVDFTMTDDGNGLIVHIKDRENYIIRRSANLSREYQLIAANVDQACLMISLVRPKTHLAFIDRFLVSAEAFRIPVILIFNKIDLYSPEQLEKMNELINMYEEIGYQAIAVSVKEQLNLEKSWEFLSHRLTVISGNSGVGKSTLLNYLDPSLKLKTKEISDYHQSGQHTTTFAEMFFLKHDARIIDTPGIKGFGMIDIERV